MHESLVILSKWERHEVGHSMGYLNLSKERLWWTPHRVTIVLRGFDIPVEAIRSIERSDNWMWRGAVNLHLRVPVTVDVGFGVNPDDWMPGFEQPIFHSDTLRLFLGFSRKKFLSAATRMGLVVEDRRR